MSRYDTYTTLIGIISVLFVLSVYTGEFDSTLKILLATFGVGVFFHSAWILYRSEIKTSTVKQFKRIQQISLIDENEKTIRTWELYGKVSMLIGKDIGENFVDIDLSQIPYSAMVEVEHAILNYADGNWYIEDLDSRNGISIKKAGEKKAYKLSTKEPCKLDFGDIILIGNCQLKVAD